jgi:hypothetical protein
MRRVLKRIAVNGLLTAALLGMIGFGLAELATIWLAGSRTTRSSGGPEPTTVEVDDTLQKSLRYRVPLTMAGWGFAFVALSEVVLYLWRGRRPETKTSPPTPQPDPAEALLEELLAQVEASRKPEDTQPRAEVQEQESEAGAPGSKPEPPATLTPEL